MAKRAIKLMHLGPVFARMNNRLKGAEYKKALQKILPKMRKRQRSIFASESDPETGKKWEKLAPSTIARKKQLGQSKKILVATGRLRASLKTPGHPDNIAKLTTTNKPRKTTLHWGTRVPYAAYHQKGTAKMPARRHIIGPDDRDAKAIIRVVTKEIAMKLKEK